MNSIFTEIKIVDLDVNATKQSPTAPGLRLMHLKLSATPSREWEQIFLAERQFARHAKWRRAYVNGPYIIVDCVPEELQECHMADVRQDTSNTNAKYQQYLDERQRKEEAQQDEHRREQERIEKIRKRLEF